MVEIYTNRWVESEIELASQNWIDGLAEIEPNCEIPYIGVFGVAEHEFDIGFSISYHLIVVLSFYHQIEKWWKSDKVIRYRKTDIRFVISDPENPYIWDFTAFG